MNRKKIRTEIRINLTSVSFEKRSRKRVSTDYKYLRNGKHVSPNLAVSRSSVFSYLPFFHLKLGRSNIYNYSKRTSADENFKFLILGCGYKFINVNVSLQARVANSIPGLTHAHAINTKPNRIFSFFIPCPIP